MRLLAAVSTIAVLAIGDLLAAAEADRRDNPFVGGANPFAALASKISRLPIWIFDSGADETVPVEQAVQALRRPKYCLSPLH